MILLIFNCCYGHIGCPGILQMKKGPCHSAFITDRLGLVPFSVCTTQEKNAPARRLGRCFTSIWFVGIKKTFASGGRFRNQLNLLKMMRVY